MTKRGKCLEIRRLGTQGETLRRIRCLPGRITVFRSFIEQELDLYTRVILGDAPGARFTVLVEDAPFERSENIFIGFRETFDQDTRTISQFLIENRMNPKVISACLLKFGLGGCEDKPLEELDEGEAETVRIVGATRQPGKILILRDPLSCVREKWREPLAQMLLDHVARRNSTVVVVRLSYRPECWIENEYISRVQLEGPRKATIGFGGTAGSDLEVLERVRREASESVPEPLQAETFEPPASSKFLLHANPAPFPKPTKGTSFLRAALYAVLALVGSAWLYEHNFLPRRIDLSMTDSEKSPVQISETEQKTAAPPGEASAGEQAVAMQDPQTDLVQTSGSHPVLEDYPEEIRRGVRLAFHQPEKLLAITKPGEEDSNGNARLEALMEAMKSSNSSWNGTSPENNDQIRSP